jgi:hypothetical protein
MAEQTTQNRVRDWLGSPDGIALLHQAAQSVSRYLSIYRIHPHFCNPHHSFDQLLEEVRSELAVFILDSVQVQQIVAFSAAKRGNFLKWAFIRRCIDQCRTSGTDEFRLIYRAMGRICRESEHFVIQKTPGRSCCFSMAPGSQSIQPLLDEDIRQIPFPHQLVPDDWMSRITHRRFLFPLLQYFWESVCSLWNSQPVWVELRYPAHWLMRFVAPEGFREVYFPDVRTTDSLDRDDFPAQDAEEPFDFHFHDASADKSFDADQVMHWASIFPNRLSHAEKAVFYLHHCIALKLKRIAEKLGYKSASGPAYPLKIAEDKLASFAADFPWISPDDLNREAFSLFREKLCLILKESICVP